MLTEDCTALAAKIRFPSVFFFVCILVEVVGWAAIETTTDRTILLFTGVQL